MNSDQFENVVDTQIKRVHDVLVVKAAEYATDDDRLHNFKRAATLRGVEVHQAIAGLMIKHTVSIYDMVGSGKTYSMDLWDEKITDHINYLILLKASLVETSDNGQMEF